MSDLTATGLKQLEQRLQQDMNWLAIPAPSWTIPFEHAEGPVLDVAIVGAGMSGLAAAAALKFQGVATTVFDKAPLDLEGPWLTTALMETLRSPKDVVGPALDLPSLTFAAWYQAQFGEHAWAALDKITRQEWARYLSWYRRVLGIQVQSEHEVLEVTPRADKTVKLRVRSPDGIKTYLARRVILALGLEAFGKPDLPAWVAGLPKESWSHSSDPLDYSHLCSKRVAVVGASAAAMDCAATALESGAQSVELLVRRADIPRLNRAKGAGSAGLTSAYRNLPDAWKWQLANTIAREQIAPPRGSTLRVTRHSNAFVNVGCPVLDAQQLNETVRLTTPSGVFDVDHVILATGFKLDWTEHAAYASFAKDLMLWGDRFAPTDAEMNDTLAANPYLGDSFEFQSLASMPGIDRIHCFSYPALLSMGHVVGAIPNISIGAKRLGEAISAKLYQEDRILHFDKICQYHEPELIGNEWIPAPPPQMRTGRSVVEGKE